ncbi:hypothetical protein FQZ97_1043910 [compost metagenome]
MWRYCKNLHPPAAAIAQVAEDAAAAKKLRNAFIRKHCKATYIVIPANDHPADYFRKLTSLEAQVQSLAPKEMRAWEGIKFPSTREPSELVDLLLNELPNLMPLVERQNAIYRKHILGEPN